MYNLEECRKQFPALNQRYQGITPIFLDGPGGSQVSQSVLDAMTQYLGRFNANLGGAYFSSKETEKMMSSARLAAKDFYHAPSENSIIFGANATSITFHMSRAIARDWQPGDEIIVTNLDHYSNVSPWVLLAEEKGVQVNYVQVNEADCTLDMAHLSKLLNKKTRLVAITCASNVTGSIVPLKEVMTLIKTRSHAISYLDAVHYAPHHLIDVQDLNCDFLITSAYKYFGPHLGVLYAKPDTLALLTPYKVAPAKDLDPNRWETGTQNYEALAGYIACINYLASLGKHQGPRREQLRVSFQQIQQHETELSKALISELSEIPNLTLYGIQDVDRLSERTPTIAFCIKDIEPRRISEFFAKQGICLWDGNFYAQGLYKQLDLSDKGGVVRIGCLHYNKESEVLTFNKKLKLLVTN
ncbi:cysteine desulfurase-like protein [Marinomonas transparens]|uniref:Cysteine desulfurase-like protein n=1 Tax=Marinomonas transparens TaxID=2795388 RepID=A0A934JJT0_9GAMM|nr:cysteine desulfurase-like protein [Marinomonas transparens]MBJ7537405.1 cysteine desulfurase-like protein [Marinomonas transparens]